MAIQVESIEVSVRLSDVLGRAGLAIKKSKKKRYPDENYGKTEKL
jgi:hypothetical protein